MGTLVSDMPVLATALASATLVLDTPTARGRPRLSPRLMLTTLTDTVSATPDSATLDLATATVWELTTVLTSDKFVQLRAAEAQHSIYRQFSFNWSRTPCAVRKERILFS